jgi:hypothetical protein
VAEWRESSTAEFAEPRHSDGQKAGKRQENGGSTHGGAPATVRHIAIKGDGGEGRLETQEDIPHVHTGPERPCETDGCTHIHTHTQRDTDKQKKRQGGTETV